MGRQAGIKLFRTDKQKLRKLLKETKDNRTYRAVLGVLLRGQGRTAEEVAITLSVSSKQVFKWCERYRKSGIEGLKLSYPPGRPAILGRKAKKRIPKLLSKEPSSFGYLKGRWVVRDIARQLQKEGVPISFQSVHLILQDLGFVLKRPRHRAPGSLHRNYLKRREIAGYKRVAAALLKKE